MTRGLLAVVPVHNEAPSVAAVVSRAGRLCPVIVVDDASTDDSASRAAAAGATCVIVHAVRRGKAAALRSGFAEALRRGARAVATLDGDGQHDPRDLPRLGSAARSLPHALVLGDRLSSADGDPVPRARLFAIRSADRAIGWVLRRPVRDSQCGFRIYPAAFLRAVVLREEGFVAETEALVRASGLGVPLVSVPVRRIYLRGRSSRFRTLSDGGRVTGYIARAVIREARRRALAPLARRAAALGNPVPRVEAAP